MPEHWLIIPHTHKICSYSFNSCFLPSKHRWCVLPPVYGNLPPVPITYLLLLYLRFPTTVLSLILLSLQLLSVGTLCINLYQVHFSNNLRKVNKIFFFLNVSLVYLLPAFSLLTYILLSSIPFQLTKIGFLLSKCNYSGEPSHTKVADDLVLSNSMNIC